jgi:intraflagellar transport protein 122
VVVAVRNRVLLYKADDGTLIESLLGHKDIVNCVDFNSDGTRFASGNSFV